MFTQLHRTLHHVSRGTASAHSSSSTLHLLGVVYYILVYSTLHLVGVVLLLPTMMQSSVQKYVCSQIQNLDDLVVFKTILLH